MLSCNPSSLWSFSRFGVPKPEVRSGLPPRTRSGSAAAFLVLHGTWFWALPDRGKPLPRPCGRSIGREGWRRAFRVTGTSRPLSVVGHNPLVARKLPLDSSQSGTPTSVHCTDGKTRWSLCAAIVSGVPPRVVAVQARSTSPIRNCYSFRPMRKM
jgi:hypothetical protein